MSAEGPEDFLARHGEFVEPAKLEALNRQAERAAREKANGGSHLRGSQPDASPKKAESAPRGAPDISETSPARGDSEHFEHYEPWPRPDLRIVDDGRAPSPTLDDDALPAGWGEWITKEAAARDCPRDYLAAALIGAASAWIGNSRHVAVNETWREPPHLWIALVGAPSTGKTPGQRPIMETCRAIERDAEPEWQAAIAEHARLAEAAGAVAEQWCADVRASTKTGQRAPDRPPGADAPDEPPRPRLVAMDATTEELQHLLSEQPRGLLYVRDELSGWFGNHDRYGGNGGDRAFFLEAWDGGSYIVDRVKHRGKPLRISRAALAILGGIQPDRLREALAGADDGLAARFAYIWPEPPPISKLANEPDETMRDRRWRLVEAARRLHGLKMSVDAAGEPAPGLLRLDQSAFALFDELRQEAMQRARSSRGLAGGWHGKAPGRALRLALVYELLTWSARGGSEPRAISADAMALASGYLDYLAGMFDRVTAGLAISREEADAEAIARNIFSTRPTALNERELYQLPGWSWLRDNERRSRALRLLADAGWIRRSGTAGRGRPNLAASGGGFVVNRWLQRLAEIDGDGARACARNTVQNVHIAQNSQPSRHSVQIEHCEQPHGSHALPAAHALDGLHPRGP